MTNSYDNKEGGRNKSGIVARTANWSQSLVTAWSEFWFSPRSLLNLALARIALCIGVLIINVSRFPSWRIFFSDEGLVPRADFQSIMPDFYRTDWSFCIWPDHWTPWILSLQCLVLCLSILGIGGRAQLLLVWAISLGFLQRNYSSAFGADMVSIIMLFYMAFTDCFARLSLLSWIRGRRSAVAAQKNILSHPDDLRTSVFYRMMQIQLCVIYSFSGFEKLKGASWWDGTALWTVLANTQMVVFDFTWVRQIPLVIPVLTFATVIFEVYFAVGVWCRPTRKYFLLIGVLFHLGIGVTMALYSFAIVMLATYFLWLPDDVSTKWAKA